MNKVQCDECGGGFPPEVMQNHSCDRYKRGFCRLCPTCFAAYPEIEARRAAHERSRQQPEEQ